MGPTNNAVVIAIGSPTTQALRNHTVSIVNSSTLDCFGFSLSLIPALAERFIKRKNDKIEKNVINFFISIRSPYK